MTAGIARDGGGDAPSRGPASGSAIEPWSGRRWFALAAAVLALRVGLSALAGTGVPDETWFLQVASRVASGERLYRDVFFGSTPLAPQIAAVVVHLFGAETVVLRGLFAVVATVASLAVLRLALLCGLRVPAAAVWFVLPLIPLPLADQIYGTLSLGLLLVAAGETLVATGLSAATFDPERRTRAAVLAGIACGASFAAKPNVGVAAGAVAFVSLLLLGDRRLLARWAASSALSAALPLLAVAVTGGAEACADQVLLGKSTYLRIAGVEPARTFHELLRGARDPSVPWARTTVDAGVVAAPLLAAAALCLALVRSRGVVRRRTAVCLAFAAAGALFLWPRPDLFHVRHVLPLGVAGVLAAVGALGARGLVGASAMLAAVGWSGVAWVRFAVGPVRDWAAGRLVASGHAGVRGVLVHPGFDERVEPVRAALAADAALAPTLVVAPDAGFWYLVSGARNPTPFDYPYATAFGREGQRHTVEAIAAGRIRTAYLAPTPPALRAQDLELAIRTHLRSDGRVGRFEVFRASGARVPSAPR